LLTIGVAVNSRSIAYVYALNRGCVDEKKDLWSYDAALWDNERPLDSILGIEGVMHVRSRGWVKLTELLMYKVRKAQFKIKWRKK
jgi:hypothetical protein